MGHINSTTINTAANSSKCKIQTIPSVVQDVEEKQVSPSSGWIVNWYMHFNEVPGRISYPITAILLLY